MADRHDLERFLHACRNLDEILLVLGGNEHRGDSAAKRRQQFLLEPADREHATAQGDLTGHRDVAPDGSAA